MLHNAGEEKASKKVDHQKILQQSALVLGPQVHPICQVCSLLQERRIMCAQHACINDHFDLLHAPSNLL